MESVVIDRSPSYTRPRFGSVDGGLLISKSFNTTCSNSFLGQKNPTFNANFTYSSLVHQPPLLPLPSTGSRSAFPQRPSHKKPCYVEAHDVVVIDKMKEKAASSSSSSFVCLASPPPSCVPMPRFSITRGKAAAATATTAEGSAAGNCVAAAAAAAAAEGNGGGGGVDVCATDGLRRLLRI